VWDLEQGLGRGWEGINYALTEVRVGIDANQGRDSDTRNPYRKEVSRSERTRDI